MNQLPVRTTPERGRLMMIAGVAWIFVFIASLVWSWYYIDQSIMALAVSEARASFQKDLIYRRWVSLQGGVYVTPTEMTPPNPYLAHMPDRDITTIDGKKLTLVNPAYMTRQVHELSWEHYGGTMRGHITSLDPIRPENAADAWETRALEAMAAGAGDVIAREIIEGQPFLRLMSPFITETSCLRCHAAQGYKEGDLRGGISVSVSLAPYFAVAGKQRLWMVLAHVLIGGLGLIGLWAGNRALRRSEKKLQNSEVRYRSIISVSNTGAWEYHRDTDYLWCSPEYFSMFGYDSDDFLAVGRSTLKEVWIDRLHPEDRKSAAAFFLNYLDTGSRGMYEQYFRMRHKNGHWIWIWSRGQTLRTSDGVLTRVTVGTHINITALKQAEAAIQRSESMKSKLIANIEEVIVIIDPDGINRYKSPNIERLFGWKPEDVVGASTWDNVHPDDLEPTREFFKRIMHESGRVGTMECRYKCRDGSYKWIEFTGSNLLDDPDIHGLLGNYHDITERRTAAEEKEKLQVQLIQAKKMESVGRLAGGVAHHFNNQLTVVMGNLELVLDDLPEDDPVRGNLFQSLAAAHKAADVSRQMLGYLGQTTGQQALIDLSEICSQTLSLLQAAMPQGMVLEAGLPGSGPVICGDPGQIQQVLASLVTNAWESIPDMQGTIGVTIKTVPHEDIDNSKCFPADWRPRAVSYACLEVSDTGCGISGEDIEKLFDPFFTTKFTGRGMGLPVVMGFVKAHEGCVTVNSEPEHGSVFRVYLPVVG